MNEGDLPAPSVAKIREAIGGFYCQNCSKVLVERQGGICAGCVKILNAKEKTVKPPSLKEAMEASAGLNLFPERSPLEISATVDGCYRYTLGRKWDWFNRIVVFVMLNPSTADIDTDDPTVGRCISFAHSWGYGGVEVVNLFAFRSTDPDLVAQFAGDPVGPANDFFLDRAIARRDALTVLAYGNIPKALQKYGRDEKVLSLLQKHHKTPMCLARTKAGHPGHPLYLRANLTPIELVHAPVMWETTEGAPNEGQ